MKIGAIAFGLVLAGCGSAPEPMTQAELENGVNQIILAFTCVQKGYVSDLPTMAAYMDTVKGVLYERASPEQISAASNARIKAYDWSTVSIQDCRPVELNAARYSNLLVANERKRQQRRKSMKELSTQPYQPRYASCLTTAVTTNCVAF